VSDKSYTLLGPDGLYPSPMPGKLGGHRKNKIYGRLDCPSALRWIKKGHYVKERVFFADQETAIICGYRPCGNCMREQYLSWKADRGKSSV
jgi:methylphosphotriester-DNA--protein-cysteine methyltransferase